MSPARLRTVASIVAGLTMAVLPGTSARGGVSPDQVLAIDLAGPGAALDPFLDALASGRLVRHVAPPALGSVELPAVPVGYALTGDQLGPLDVTGTPEAERALDAFQDRLGDKGIDNIGMRFSVYTLPPVQEALDAGARIGAANEPLGSSVIVPEGTVVKLVGAFWDGHQLQVKTTVEATGQSPERKMRAMGAPSDSLRWERAGGVECLDRKQNSTAHYDPCQWFWTIPDDREPGYAYWAVEMYGTGKGHSVWTLNGLEVDSHRAEGSAGQDWVDWDPGADASTNCHSQSVSVSYGGVGLGVDKQHCEMWDIDKGEDGADMSNWWRGHVRRKERETAAMTVTRLAEGRAPRNAFDFDFYANP